MFHVERLVTDECPVGLLMESIESLPRACGNVPTWNHLARQDCHEVLMSAVKH